MTATDPLQGLEAARRAGWAKYYEAERRAAAWRQLVAQILDRVIDDWMASQANRARFDPVLWTAYESIEAGELRPFTLAEIAEGLRSIFGEDLSDLIPGPGAAKWWTDYRPEPAGGAATSVLCLECDERPARDDGLCTECQRNLYEGLA